MKKISFLFVVFFFLIFKCQAQSDSIIIDPFLSSIFVTDIADTLITSYSPLGCGTENYNLDIDGNNISDFTFSLTCYLGGMGTYAWIKLNSFDGSWFSADSSVTDSVCQLDSIGQIVCTPETFSMVRIYNSSDTLYTGDCLNQTSTNISNISTGNYPGYIEYNSLDNWISGDHYIGIRKIIDNVNYLGWIKVEVVDYNKIIVKEYALNRSFLGVNPIDASQSSIFPNPFRDRLFFNSSAGPGNIKIFSLTGVCLVQREFSSGINSIDLSNLPKGVYFFQTAGDDYFIQQKLIKE